MSSRTSSRSTLTTVPSTIWPSSTDDHGAVDGVLEAAAEVVVGDLAGGVRAVLGEGAEAVGASVASGLGS